MEDLKVKGSLNETKGKIKQLYGQLVDDNKVKTTGKLDELLGYIQQRTGKAKETIVSELNKLNNNNS